MVGDTFKRKIIRFGRELPGILGPLLLTVAVAVLLLRLLNAAPDYWARLAAGQSPARPVLNEKVEFHSIEEAERELGVKVAIPIYFPSSLIWPPASIRGQQEPARVVSLLFLSADGRQALQIREIFSREEESPLPVPEPIDVLERREVEVNGIGGLLLLGRSQDGGTLNQLRWHTGGVHLVVTTIYPPEELLRISESIHPDGS
jgi:hypothetical protein